MCKSAPIEPIIQFQASENRISQFWIFFDSSNSERKRRKAIIEPYENDEDFEQDLAQMRLVYGYR